MTKNELEKIDKVSKIFNFSSIYDDNGKIVEPELVDIAKDFIEKYNPSNKFLEAAEQFNNLNFNWARIKDGSLKKYIPNRSLHQYDSPHLFFFEDSSLTERDGCTPSINKINGETFDDREDLFSINVKDITCLTYEDLKFFNKDNDINQDETREVLYKKEPLQEKDMPIVENYIKELTKLEKSLEKNKKKSLKNIGD